MWLSRLLGKSESPFGQEEGTPRLLKNKEVGDKGEKADDSLEPEHPVIFALALERSIRQSEVGGRKC
jgi:hypothetical protein